MARPKNIGTRVIHDIVAEDQARAQRLKVRRAKPVPPVLSEKVVGAPKNELEKWFTDRGITLEDLK